MFDTIVVGVTVFQGPMKQTDNDLSFFVALLTSLLVVDVNKADPFRRDVKVLIKRSVKFLLPVTGSPFETIFVYRL